MERIVYRVTVQGSGYGILAVDMRTGHSAVTMPFLRSREEAEMLVRRLSLRQLSVERFREAYLSGRLENEKGGTDHGRNQ